MGHTLSLELPQAQYDSLLTMAERMGRKPEEVAAEWLAATIQRIASDPLLQLSGTIGSDVTDVAERHDEYIGEALLSELRLSELRLLK